LLAALASYLDAKHQRGTWLLRIEDVDPYRSLPEAADGILRTLERFGLCWDEAVLRQSQRLERYRQVLDELDRQGRIYPCNCSRKQLAEQGYRSERYPNHCRLRQVSRREPHALRLITHDRPITLHDRLQGDYTMNLEQDSGDIVLYRRDQAYAYHLAVVVDDHDQGISHIVRGIDLLDSTPRHIHLQQLLGYPTPQYLHIPVILAPDGQKLSKQTGAAAADQLEPSATLCLLLALLGHPPPAELHGAPPGELLAWAVAAWTEQRLPKCIASAMHENAGTLPSSGRLAHP
jgi:glutamyl-Q tRNA(Asp) synthetase